MDENQDICAVSSNYWWQFFLVARLIKDKADASSTVNQSVICELFVWSWNSIQNVNRSVFRAKYLKSEIEFEGHYLLCVCCVFATFPSFWRPFGAIFCWTVDATSRQSKGTSTWQDVASTVKQNIAPKRHPAVRKSGKDTANTQQITKGFSNSILIFRYFPRKTADYFQSNFSSIQTVILRFGDLCFVYCITYCSTIFRDFPIHIS